MTVKIISGAASSEIKSIKNIPEIKKWLISKNVLFNDDKLFYYEDIFSWCRSGTESYWTVFKIGFERQNKKHFKKVVIKALVSMFPSDSLTSWSEKRDLLKTKV